MNKNHTTEYINIQDGGLVLLNQVNQAYKFNYCSGEAINSYLGLEVDKKPVPVQQFYNHFVIKNTITDSLIEQIAIKINTSLTRLEKLNKYIHTYLGNKSKLKDTDSLLNLDFTNDQKGYESYVILCNLYRNNVAYITSTNEINQLLCKMSIADNYLKKNKDCTNDELLESLDRLRKGIKVELNIKSFIKSYSEYMKILNPGIEVPNLEKPDPFELYNYLVNVANEFKKKLPSRSILLDEYIKPINRYYLSLCEKSIVQCETQGIFSSYKSLDSSDFKDLFTSNNTTIISKKFPHLLKIIKKIKFGPNKFFKLYNYVKDFYDKSTEEQTTELTKLENITKVYTKLQVYKPDISNDTVYSEVFENQDQDISRFFNDKLTKIFNYKNLPVNDFNSLVKLINSKEKKKFFKKDLIEAKYKTYLGLFNLEQNTSYLNPNYGIFESVFKDQYPRFIENLTNGKLISKDLSANINKFIEYVNVFRTMKVESGLLIGLFVKLYIENINEAEQEQIKEFVLYNKLLNDRFRSNVDNSTIIDYKKLLEILVLIDLSYLNSFKNPDYDSIKTKSEFKNNEIPKNLLSSRCVIKKMLNKQKISRIELLIHIVDCKINEKSESINKLIYFYLTLNTKEINSSRLISWKKLNTILSTLSSGTCTPKQIDILIQVIELKKIIDPFLRTELNSLKTNQDIQKQIYIYNLLSALAPEKINWNIIGLLKDYATENLMPGIFDVIKWGASEIFNSAKSYIYKPETKKVAKKATKEILSVSEFKKYVFEKINVENFFDVKLKYSDPQYKFTCFKIYSYFNFDAVIVPMETIQKIVLQFEKNKFDKEIFKTLKKIIIRNSKNLEQINKSSSPKLDYFLQTKWDKLETDPYYIYQLYDILKEVAEENLFPVNVLDYLKEKGIDVIIDDEVKDNTADDFEENVYTLGDLYSLASNEETSYQITKLEKQVLPIYKMFEAFIDEKILESKKQILIDLDNMKHGICEDTADCSMNRIIQLINQSAPFIKSNDQIKIYFATNKHINPDYASEQELFSVLEGLSKSSALIKNVTAQVTQVATDTIYSAVNSKLQSVALDYGLTEVPVDAIAKAKEIAETAKTIAVTAGIGFATAGAYYAVDKLFGNSSGSENTSLAAYEENDFKSKLKLFIGTVGTGLTLYSAKSLFPGITSLVQDYIKYKTSEYNLPMPSISMVVIGGIIMSGITKYLSGSQEGGDGTNLTKSLIEKILDWIFDAIDKLYGFNGKKPEPIDQSDQTYQKKNIESVYVYLTSQKLGSDDIFNGAVINEHPDQIAILNALRKKYREFSKMSLDSNPYVVLAKKDKKKIKKIIGQIVALELNTFKGNEPYTFVNAISKFLNE